MYIDTYIFHLKLPLALLKYLYFFSGSLCIMRKSTRIRRGMNSGGCFRFFRFQREKEREILFHAQHISESAEKSFR